MVEKDLIKTVVTKPKRAKPKKVKKIKIKSVTPKKKRLYVSTIKKRGWTDGAIKRFLGEPDVEIPNPHYKTGPKSHLYDEDRVLAAEQTDEFKAWQLKTTAGRLKASKRMVKINDERKQELVEYIDQLKIFVPRMPEHTLFGKAVDHYNALWWDRGNFDKCASLADDREFLKRIALNMLRHDYTDYENQIYDLFGKVGKDQGYILIRDKVIDAILKVYPFLESKDE